MKSTSVGAMGLCWSHSALFAAALAFSACGGAGFSANSDASSSSGASGANSSGGQSRGGATGSAGANAGGVATSGGVSGIAGAALGGSGGGAGLVGSGGLVEVAGSTAGGAASECPCAAPTPTCSAGTCVVRGPKMVKANGFYIDSTEVTVEQYAAFEKAKGTDTSGQATECAWNTSYDPAFDPTAPMPTSNLPVTNVDYCDAAAFCAWANEKVCGKIGSGDLPLASLADATQSQWFEACAGPHGQLYPYGTSYQAGACNDSQSGKPLEDVGSFSQCQGFYPGLFDMIGNAQEWTSACNGKTGNTDGCERIGGSHLDSTSCGQSGLAQRDLQAPELGFRCCSL